MDYGLFAEPVAEPLSVGDYIEQLNIILKRSGGRVVGEVSSVKDSYSKAVYFSIKDPDSGATLDCMIWKSSYAMSGVSLEPGMEVILTGIPEIYAPYGKFSFKAQTIELSGEGRLRAEYEKLKKKFTDEGLFDTARKRKLPALPQKIGVITSRSGVVIKDFTTNIGRHGLEIILCDSRVEGKDAIHDLHAALETMKKQDIDVLVMLRGGGSLESLQAFNNESLVRAVAAFPVPVITGIGHDTDITFVQLVADHGASTPTGAAQRIHEAWDFAKNTMLRSELKILRAYSSAVEEKQAHLHHASRIVHEQFAQIEKRITSVRHDVNRAVQKVSAQLEAHARTLESSGERLVRLYDSALLSVPARRIAALSVALSVQGRALGSSGEALVSLEKQIAAYSPEKNLRLGYSLVFSGGTIVRAIKDVTPGATLTTRLHDGEFTSRVEAVE